MAEYKTSGGYGKRPLWQWIVIYLVIGIVVYGLIYYFVIAKKYGYNYNTGNPQGQPNINQVSIYTIKIDAVKGKYITDHNGMTLYTFDKDTKNMSNCYDNCETVWPPYISKISTNSTLQGNISLVTRKDNSKQFAWKDMPLYYYATDSKSGDITGDGVGGVWHIVKM